MSSHTGRASAGFPDWIQMSPERIAHVERVVALLVQWGEALRLSGAELAKWVQAGFYHDAVKDASEGELRRMTPGSTFPAWALHGAAAAARMLEDGGFSVEVIEAVRDHTLGTASVSPTLRALYCADFLEPGRAYYADVHAGLARDFPVAPDLVFRTVVAMRIERSLRNGSPLHQHTVAMWNAIATAEAV